MTDIIYPAPLDRLLTLGNAWTMKPWPDYLALGLAPENIPDLIRMATDPELNEGESESGEVWAPAHAWRALAQLHAVEAAVPLTQLFQRIDRNHDDFVGEDLPEAFGLLGPGAIPVLTAYLEDVAHDLWARIAAARSLARIAARHADARDACVVALSAQLGQFALQDPALNGCLMAYLVDVNAVEAAPLMEQAFRSGQVDEMVTGDWEAVQEALGLEAQGEQPRQPPQTGTAAAAVYELAAGLKRPSPTPTPQSVVEARLGQALRESQPDDATGPKRKHHRKRK